MFKIKVSEMSHWVIKVKACLKYQTNVTIKNDAVLPCAC